MFNIQKSFADCSNCPLLSCPSCILETNYPDDLSKVEVVFVAENPGNKEIEQGAPLIGPSGQVFRSYFDRYFVKYFRYLLTNVVLCQTLKDNGTTGNPSWYVTDRCKSNCFEIIKHCNPNLIVVMGSSAMRAFGIAEAGITKLRGKMYKWNNYNLFLTVHPSYVLRNGSYDLFEEDLQIARNFLINQLIHLNKVLDQRKTSWVSILNSHFVFKENYEFI
jgi:DNA polymerase